MDASGPGGSSNEKTTANEGHVTGNSFVHATIASRGILGILGLLGILGIIGSSSLWLALSLLLAFWACLRRGFGAALDPCRHETPASFSLVSSLSGISTTNLTLPCDSHIPHPCRQKPNGGQEAKRG